MANLTVPVTVKIDMDEIKEYLASKDVVEIIRCGKCKHRKNDEESPFNNCCLIHRDYHGLPMEKGPYDFCSCGERKETNENN